MKAETVKGKFQPTKKKVCIHQRVVDHHYNDEGIATGNLVCRECGAVIPDPLKMLKLGI